MTPCSFLQTCQRFIWYHCEQNGNSSQHRVAPSILTTLERTLLYWGVREPHVVDSTFDSVAAVLHLQTITDAGHVATTSLPFVTASDTLS